MSTTTPLALVHPEGASGPSSAVSPPLADGSDRYHSAAVAAAPSQFRAHHSTPGRVKRASASFAKAAPWSPPSAPRSCA